MKKLLAILGMSIAACACTSTSKAATVYRSVAVASPGVVYYTGPTSVVTTVSPVVPLRPFPRWYGYQVVNPYVVAPRVYVVPRPVVRPWVYYRLR